MRFEINAKESTLAIPHKKELALVFEIQEKFFDERGGLLDVVNTTALGKLVGTFYHMSQAWSLGKTLLWPLYTLLKDFREVTPEGKLRYRQAQVKFGYDAVAALMEWYERINVCGIYKKFYSCNGTYWTTPINIWCGRNFKVFASGKKSTKGVKNVNGSKTLELSFP